LVDVQQGTIDAPQKLLDTRRADSPCPSSHLLLVPILSRQWTVLRHQPLHASPQALELVLDIFGPLALGLDSRRQWAVDGVQHQSKVLEETLGWKMSSSPFLNFNHVGSRELCRVRFREENSGDNDSKSLENRPTVHPQVS